MNTFFNQLQFINVDAFVYVHNRDSLERVAIGNRPEVELSTMPYKGRKNVLEYNSYIEKKHTHRSLLFMKAAMLSIIGKRGPLISDSETVNNFRGQGIFPFTIFSIAKELVFQKNYPEVFILVVPTNIASIRGIEKAGFVRKYRIKATRFLWIYFRKQVTKINE